jgi:hypothetical protein
MARGRLERKVGTRRYKTLVLIATEGAKTEPRYFRMFNDERRTIRHVDVLKGKNRSEPNQVLSRMKRRLREESIRKGDQAWLVVDRDQWEEEDLRALLNWSLEADGRGLAVSHPKFEFWLLMHFENPKGVSTAGDCDHRLTQHDAGYSKSGFNLEVYRSRVRDAVEHAKQRDRPPVEDWPRTAGSTVYRVVEKLI